MAKSILRVGVTEDINETNNNINYDNIDIKILSDFEDLKSDLLGSGNRFTNILNQFYEEINLNDKGYIYLISGKDNCCYNFYNNNTDKIQKSFSDIEIFTEDLCLTSTISDLNDYIHDPETFTKEYIRIIKFYTEDNGLGEYEPEFFISIKELFQTYNLNILRYEYQKDNTGHYTITDADETIDMCLYR